MIRLLAPLVILPLTACAQVDTPPTRAEVTTTRAPAIIGADRPVNLGSMTVVATALPPG